MIVLRWIFSVLYKKPTVTLTWTVGDFQKAKRYCLSQPHPHKKNSTLWSYLKNLDSVEILDFVNRKLFLNV